MELRQLLTYIIYLGIFSGIASNECCHLYTSKKSYVQIKGIVVSPLGIKQEEFFANCKVLVDDGQANLYGTPIQSYYYYLRIIIQIINN